MIGTMQYKCGMDKTSVYCSSQCHIMTFGLILRRPQLRGCDARMGRQTNLTNLRAEMSALAARPG